MNSNAIFGYIGDFLTWVLSIFDSIGNIFNFACIVLGFIGLFYWLNLQRKFNAEAANNADQIK